MSRSEAANELLTVIFHLRDLLGPSRLPPHASAAEYNGPRVARPRDPEILWWRVSRARGATTRSWAALCARG